ncbi:MAG: hypothetical protein MUE35_13680 [Hydrogenophaga sp.]|jgi:hypothetical protein|nr:hypothetical protein [Hydrogenophaga sp.]
MSLRQIRRRHNAGTGERLAYARGVLAAMVGLDDWEDWDDEPDRGLTCPACGGSGRDEWNDGILPCEECDGEGYQWWN